MAAVARADGSGKGVVLIGFAEALPAPEAAWSLADQGFQVVAFGRKGRRSALQRSRYVEVHGITPPETEVEGALRDLHELCRHLSRGARRIVFPLDDTAMWLCAQAALPSGCLLAGCEPEGTRLALDKGFQLSMAERAGFRTLTTRVANTPDEVQDSIKHFPVMLKAASAVVVREGRVGKGRNWICGNAQELERALGQWQGRWAVLVQPFLAGTGEGVFGLAAAGGVQAWSSHRRLRMMNPHGSGSSACMSQPVPEDVKRCAERLVQDANWRGLFMVELLRDRAGERWFMEFNGRAWGSMALSRRQGLEYPGWAVQLALDPTKRIDTAPAGTANLVCRNAGRELMHLLFVIRGRKSVALEDWPTVWSTMRAVCRFARTERFYNYRRDDRPVFFSDCWHTVRDQIFKP